jgi:hypothetical protein
VITITNTIIVAIITIAIITIAIITIAIIPIAIITIAIITIAIIPIAIITIASITMAIIPKAIITISLFTIRTKYTHIHPQSVGNKYYILLEHLRRRSAVPKIKLSTIPAESRVIHVNTITMRHGEILLRWPC